MSNRQNSGFTLIEVLVALAIFGVMSVLAYLALSLALNNTEMLNARMDRLRDIQRTVRYLTNDLSMAVPRPVRGELGDIYAPAVLVSAGNDFALAVTHGGWSNPAGLPRGTLQRSVYVIEEGTLLRVYYNVLDATYSNNPVSQELIDGVEALEFRLIQDNGDPILEWPPVNSPPLTGLRLRPRAVEIILTLEDEGEIRRIVEVAS